MSSLAPHSKALRALVSLTIWISTHAAVAEVSSSEPGTPQVEIHEVVDLSLRQIYVTVTDRKQRRVLDLDPEDFELLDGGVRQQIVTFERGEIPFTAILLIDTSDSMNTDRLRAARRGAELFLGGMEAFDEAAILAFADRPLLVSPFSTNPAYLNAALSELTPGGGTAIHDYLFLALRRLENRHGRRVVILLSHGQDAHSVLRMQQVQEVARGSQALLYWIRILPEETPPTPIEASLPSAGTDPGLESRLRNRQIQHRVQPPAFERFTWVDSWRDLATNQRQEQILRETIEDSGGRILDVTRPIEIAAAFGDILTELRAQYAVGYYPSGERGDGNWRKIRVKLSRGGLQARANGGYLDM